MSTYTLTPLDEATRAVGEAAVAMENAWKRVDEAQDFYHRARTASARKTLLAARQRYSAAVEVYDAAREVLDAEIAKRPDLLLCTCGHPECEYRA